MGEAKHNPNAIAKKAGAFSGQGAAGTVEYEPITTQYGHNGDRVVMIYSKTVLNQALTEQETEDMIAALQTALKGLRDHKAGLPPPANARVINPGAGGNA